MARPLSSHLLTLARGSERDELATQLLGPAPPRDGLYPVAAAQAGGARGTVAIDEQHAEEDPAAQHAAVHTSTWSARKLLLATPVSPAS